MSTPRPNLPRRNPNPRPTPRDLAPLGPRGDADPPRPPLAEPDDHYDTYDGPDDATAAQGQDIEANGHYVTADLCGEQVRIIPPGAWRQSWNRHLNAGRVDAFAEEVIHPGDLDLYYDLDPTNDEFGEFVGEAAERAGESLGKSPGPSRSSRRTRRR